MKFISALIFFISTTCLFNLPALLMNLNMDSTIEQVTSSGLALLSINIFCIMIFIFYKSEDEQHHQN